MEDLIKEGYVVERNGFMYATMPLKDLAFIYHQMHPEDKCSCYTTMLNRFKKLGWKTFEAYIREFGSYDDANLDCYKKMMVNAVRSEEFDEDESDDA